MRIVLRVNGLFKNRDNVWDILFKGNCVRLLVRNGFYIFLIIEGGKLIGKVLLVYKENNGLELC